MIWVDLFRAEWTKIAGHRWLTAFMVWVFPVGAFAFIVVLALLVVLVPPPSDDESADWLELEDAQWTEQAINAWDLPNSLLGRLVMMGFTSVIFAGEYQWGTWKNVVPHSNRIPLVVIKFLATGAFILMAFVLMSFILAAGWGLLVRLAGETYGPAITGDVLAEFGRDYTQRALLAFSLTMISAGIAALAAMLTRSILGGVLVSILATYAEGLSVLVLALLAYLLKFPRLVYLYRLTPSYNIANVESWLNTSQAETEQGGMTLLGDMIDFADSLEFSAVVLAAWVVGLIALTAYLFNRQDLTT